MQLLLSFVTFLSFLLVFLSGVNKSVDIVRKESSSEASAKCLESPREIVWTFDDETQSHKAKIDFKMGTVKHLQNLYKFKTRLYDGSIKAPLLRMRRGEKYSLTIHNKLENNAPEKHPNCNITNLHTHGLHVRGMAPGDSILTKIMPGKQHTYHYNLPIDHVGGIHWYHPHYHQTTDFQVGGGAAGVIIVEDDPQFERLPFWMRQIKNEMILQIFHVHFNFVKGAAMKLQCDLQYSGLNDFYLVNGEYKPTICLKSDEWTRLRMSHVDNAFVMTMIFEDECEIRLLAKDGILLNEVPRNLPYNRVYFNQASRVDIIIKCPKGIFTIKRKTMKASEQALIANIVVNDGVKRVGKKLILRTFKPKRPLYLKSTLNVQRKVQSLWKVKVTRSSINDIKFAGPDDFEYMHSDMIIGTIEEWELIPDAHGHIHPLHLHVFPFQLQSNCGDVKPAKRTKDPFDNEDDDNIDDNPFPPGWYQKGDWHDTINCGVKIRFRVVRFDGDIYLHCHVLRHEDMGAMAMRRAVHPKITNFIGR